MILNLLTFTTIGLLSLASQTHKDTTPSTSMIGETRSVVVKQVLDGDTFITTKGEHVRVWGINSPEKDEAGFWASGMFLDMKARGQKLLCKTMAVDKYARTVMQCTTASGTDIGSWMVKSGYARDFTKYSKGFYKPEEKAAKSGKQGLWNPKSGYSPKLKYTP